MKEHDQWFWPAKGGNSHENSKFFSVWTKLPLNDEQINKWFIAERLNWILFQLSIYGRPIPLVTSELLSLHHLTYGSGRIAGQNSLSACNVDFVPPAFSQKCSKWSISCYCLLFLFQYKYKGEYDWFKLSCIRYKSRYDEYNLDVVNMHEVQPAVRRKDKLSTSFSVTVPVHVKPDIILGATSISPMSALSYLVSLGLMRISLPPKTTRKMRWSWFKNKLKCKFVLY